MAQGYYGSICLNDLFQGAITTDQQGNKWVNLSALQGPHIKNGQNNGKTYVNIGAFVNDQPDGYGNIAGITLSQSKEQREAGQKRVYIGNLKTSGGGAPAQAQAPQQTTPPVAIPFGVPPAGGTPTAAGVPPSASNADLPF